MITIQIMTKNECSLCDIAKAVIEKVLPDYPAQMILTDIESDPDLFERYREKIPVILINGEESFIYKVRETALRKMLGEILEGSN